MSKTFNFLGILRCYVQWLFPYTLKWEFQHSMSKVAISPTNYHKNIHNKWQLTTYSCQLHWLWQSRPTHNQIKSIVDSHLGCGNCDWWNNLFYNLKYISTKWYDACFCACMYLEMLDKKHDTWGPWPIVLLIQMSNIIHCC